MAYLRLVNGQVLYQRMSFYCSFHKVVHFCVHHAAGLTVTATVLILAICFVWHEKNCRDNSECMVIRDLSANSLVTLPLNLTALKSSRLSANVVDSVESFVLFLGMDDRMLGRLLNHHPEVAIASGFNLFQRWHFQKSILQKKSLLLTLLVSNHPNVLNSKEGATHKLTIVGDYSSLSMTALCTTSPIYCCHVCSQLQETLRTPLKFVQVVANPYDSISAMTLLSLEQARMTSTFKSEYVTVTDNFITVTDERSILIDNIERYFHTVKQLMVFKQLSQVYIHYVHWYDLQQDTVGTLQSLCDFLTIPCSEDYIKYVQKVMAQMQFHRPRSQVPWTDDLVSAVEQNLTGIPWIQRYRYDREANDIL